MEAPALLSPFSLRGVRLRNRIAVSPMCQYSSEDGFADEWHVVHLGSRAAGGAGIVMAEATAVEPRGRITPWDLGLWKDEHIEVLARIARFIDSQGAVPAIQLAHAGRKASTARPWEGGHVVPVEEGGWRPVAPSPIPFQPSNPAPEELSAAGIRDIVEAFAAAAWRALQAGFRVIEIHAAHGYLIHEFLSPLSNCRTDEYGGTLENRSRLLHDVIRAVRRVWRDDLPVFVRISATDWADGGWNIEESVQLARALKPMGADLIDCSSGGLVPGVKIPLTPGYQVPFAEQIRREAGIATGAVGLITQPEQADDIVREGKADIVLLAREFLRNPYWPFAAARRLGYRLDPPVQYRRAYD